MATNDLLTLAEARAAVSIDASDTSQDSGLALYNTAVSERLDEICGPVVQRTVTSELHDGGRHWIQLYFRPVASVTTATEYVGTTGTTLTAESNASKPASAYMLETRTGIVRRRASGGDSRFAIGRQNIALTYSAGRYATTAVVGERFKLAAQIMLSHIWRVERGGGNQTFGEFVPSGSSFAVPNRVLELLADELLEPVVV